MSKNGDVIVFPSCGTSVNATLDSSVVVPGQNANIVCTICLPSKNQIFDSSIIVCKQTCATCIISTVIDVNSMAFPIKNAIKIPDLIISWACSEVQIDTQNSKGFLAAVVHSMFEFHISLSRINPVWVSFRTSTNQSVNHCHIDSSLSRNLLVGVPRLSAFLVLKQIAERGRGNVRCCQCFVLGHPDIVNALSIRSNKVDRHTSRPLSVQDRIFGNVGVVNIKLVLLSTLEVGIPAFKSVVRIYRDAGIYSSVVRDNILVGDLGRSFSRDKGVIQRVSQRRNHC